MGKYNIQIDPLLSPREDNYQVLEKLTEGPGGDILFDDQPLATIEYTDDIMTEHTHDISVVFKKEFTAGDFSGGSITIPIEEHACGYDSIVQVWSEDGGDYQLDSGAWKQLAGGDVVIEATPFNGKIIMVKSRAETDEFVPTIQPIEHYSSGVYDDFVTLNYTPTKGNLLLAVYTPDKENPNMFLDDPNYEEVFINASGSISQGVWWKIATGDETTLTANTGGSNRYNHLVVIEYDIADVDISNPIFIGSSNATTVASPTITSVETVSPTAIKGTVNAIFGIDSSDNFSVPVTVTNNYESTISIQAYSSAGSNLLVYREGTDGDDDVTTTFTHSGSGDQSVLSLVGVTHRRLDYVDDPTKQVFAALADFGSGTSNEADVADMIWEHDVDGIISPGDLAYDNGTWQEFQDNLLADQFYGYFITRDILTNRFWPVPGNHDYGQANDPAYLTGKMFYDGSTGAFVLPTNPDGNQRYYSKRLGNVHIVGIDSQYANADDTDRDAQIAFMQSEFSTSDATFKIVFFHHNTYSTGLTHPISPDMSNTLWDFGSHCDLVLMGHEHNAEHIIADGIDYCIIGNGGKSLYNNWDLTAVQGVDYEWRDATYYGAMIITVENDIMTCEFKDTVSTIKHSFTIDKS